MKHAILSNLISFETKIIDLLCIIFRPLNS